MSLVLENNPLYSLGVCFFLDCMSSVGIAELIIFLNVSLQGQKGRTNCFLKLVSVYGRAYKGKIESFR